jgi:O-antigen/teichoic acid export membrane protein
MLAGLTTVVGFPVMRGLLAGTDPELVSLSIRFLIAYVPFNYIVLMLAAVDQGRMHFGRFNLLRLLPQIVYLLALVGLGLSQLASVTTLVWAVWLGTAVTCGVRVLAADRAIWAKPDAGEARDLLKTGLGFHLTTVITVFAAQLDKIFVVSFWQNQDIGYYTVALTFAVAGVSVITSAFDTVLFPRLATTRTRLEQRATLARAVRVGMLLLTLTAVALAVLSRWLVPALFGRAFLTSVPVGVVLLAAQVPGALRQIIVGGLRGLREWRARAAAEAIAVVSFAMSALPLSALLGLQGIGIALLSANLLALVFCLIHLKKAHSITLRDWWGLSPRAYFELVQEIRALSRGMRRRSRS